MRLVILAHTLYVKKSKHLDGCLVQEGIMLSTVIYRLRAKLITANLVKFCLSINVSKHIYCAN
jgi:hypothetical protein